MERAERENVTVDSTYTSRRTRHEDRVLGAKFFGEKAGMGTKSKKENPEGLLPDGSFNPAEGRGDAPAHTKKSLNSVTTCLRSVDTRRGAAQCKGDHHWLR